MGLIGMMSFLNKYRFFKDEQLQDSCLVIDGNNLCGYLYEVSHVNLSFGGEYDVIAKETRRIFKFFQESRIDCKVVFDGGHNAQSIEKKNQRQKKNIVRAVTGEHVAPVFLDFVVMSVLREMGVQYVMCSSNEADGVIAATAKHFNCPVLSNDTDFTLSESPLIIISENDVFNCKHSPDTDFITCKVYRRSNLQKQFKISNEKLPIVGMILDNNDKNKFESFFTRNNINRFNRIVGLLNWLIANDYDGAIKAILAHLPSTSRKDCLSALDDLRKITEGSETNSPAFRYLCNANCSNAKEDVDWFEKGVLNGCIAKPYINLYMSRKFYSLPQNEGVDQEDSFLPCLPIVRYAFDLMVGFTDEKFEYVGRKGLEIEEWSVSSEISVSPPPRTTGSPFISGDWEASDLPSYFDHFLDETLPGLPRERISALPQDCRLPVVALVWWRVHAAVAAAAETDCLLLCWVRGRAKQQVRPAVAAAESSGPYDARLLHAFAKFQHVLYQLECLRRLCRADEYGGWRCEIAYCGNFVYAVLRSMLQSAPDEFWVERRLRAQAAEKYAMLRRSYNDCYTAVLGQMQSTGKATT